jgi:hypothetical protein
MNSGTLHFPQASLLWSRRPPADRDGSSLGQASGSALLHKIVVARRQTLEARDCLAKAWSQHISRGSRYRPAMTSVLQKGNATRFAHVYRVTRSFCQVRKAHP